MPQALGAQGSSAKTTPMPRMDRMSPTQASRHIAGGEYEQMRVREAPVLPAAGSGIVMFSPSCPGR